MISRRHKRNCLKTPKFVPRGYRISAAFRMSAHSIDHRLDYKNQISVLNGKKAGSDINLYKLFLEQSFNLLREGGRCGIITSGGIHTDLGTKQLREMLFSQCVLDTLFGLSNERFIFENVHHAQKFCLVVFEKGGKTTSFRVAFRINPREAVAATELDEFLNSDANHLRIPVDLVRRLSPDSLSIMEFKSKVDIAIAEKALKFPLLGEKIDDSWNVQLIREFDMTNDSALFKTSPANGRLPLYEGKMIWHFDHRFAQERYWVDEKQGRKALVGKDEDSGQMLDYQRYRCGIRAVASNTNERSLISSVIPAGAFCGNSVLTTVTGLIEDVQTMFLVAVLNSLVVDSLLRLKVTTNINMFFLYQLPIPRLTKGDQTFKQIVLRAARLICTTPEFDTMAKSVGMTGYKAGATDPTERARLRAELDALVAHLYGLTEEEFSHVLATFPLIHQSVKDDALAAYKAAAPKDADQQVRSLIAGGETVNLEFKSSARWDLKQNTASKLIEQIVVKTSAGFLNADSGGTLLLGVDDDGNVLGLENDYKTMGKKPNRDGYENWLTTLLLGEFGKDASPLIRMTFHDIDGKDVCQVAFKPSPRPIFVKDGNAEHLYIRTGNSTRLLTSREAIEYSKQRWP